jgi:transcription factor IIIB subunit 2
MDCGYIIGENAITSEVSYAEGAGGQHSVVESFVSNTNQRALSDSAAGSGFGSRTESRQLTIQKGNRNIKHVGSLLNIHNQYIEAAQRLFLVAVQRTFLQGRKGSHVVAACLYIVCRREKTPHMLIDFSDVLQTNLYVLGKTFMKFVRMLNLSLPIVDPSLFIRRFAAALEFGEKTNMVAMTALRLVARMKRDWLQIGRRPSGICGAALLIAARIHGFKRSQKEIVRVVHVGEATLRKRLAEFMATPASAMTVDEFNLHDIDKSIEQNPPAWTRNVEKEKLLLLTDKVHTFCHFQQHLLALASALSSFPTPLLPCQRPVSPLPTFPSLSNVGGGA